MRLVLVDIYVTKDTMLHRLDPRAKIIGALLLLSSGIERNIMSVVNVL